VYAASLEDLHVYSQALEAADAISALLKRPGFRQDLKLRDQLRESSGKVPAQISEGFGQKTDRHFAHYLYVARGSTNETRTHLRVAFGREYISASDLAETTARYEAIGKRLTRLIQHLEREDRKQRG
jgi:four helix bundle protein